MARVLVVGDRRARPYRAVAVRRSGADLPALRAHVRRYLYDRARTDRMVGISYLWCSNCRGYSGSTGVAASDCFGFADPADERPDLARLRDSDLMGLLDLLDNLWNDGVLPQKVVPKRRSR